MKNSRKLSKMQRDEIRHTILKVQKRKGDIKAYRRLLALSMYGKGKSRKEISETVGYGVQYITELVSKYLNEGIEAIVTDKRTSNNRRMSFADETEFLDQFVDMAEAGQLVTVKIILEKFEEVTGKPSNTTTIYQLLKRHGWRKVRPRPAHPGKASEEEILSSKKLTKNSGSSYWKKIEEIAGTNTSITKA